MSNQKFAKLLKSARKKAGISQKELAMQVGVSQPMINKYERGISTPCNDKLIGIYQALELDVDAAIAVSIKHVRAKKHSGFCYCSGVKFSSTAALLKACVARKEKGDARCQRCEVLKTSGKDEEALKVCNITIMGYGCHNIKI